MTPGADPGSGAAWRGAGAVRSPKPAPMDRRKRADAKDGRGVNTTYTKAEIMPTTQICSSS
jgi:hypothetical protein